MYGPRITLVSLPQTGSIGVAVNAQTSITRERQLSVLPSLHRLPPPRIGRWSAGRLDLLHRKTMHRIPWVVDEPATNLDLNSGPPLVDLHSNSCTAVREQMCDPSME